MNCEKNIYRPRLQDFVCFRGVSFYCLRDSIGPSPAWFVDDAKKGLKGDFIAGGESAWGAILADQKQILFFAGEADHRDIYAGLKASGFSDLDVLGFYVARQIPQWVRERENREGLLERKTPAFLASNCQVFAVKPCPTLAEVQVWYREKNGQELSSEVPTYAMAPIHDGQMYTQKISSVVGDIRDRFTLGVIERLLQQFRRVGVIYGAGHFVTLRKSFDSELGPPVLKFLPELQQVQ